MPPPSITSRPSDARPATMSRGTAVLILVLAAAATAAWLLADDRVIVHPARADVPSPRLEAGTALVQTFVPPADGIEAVAVRLATYRQVVDGGVRIELRGPLGARGAVGEGDGDGDGDGEATGGTRESGATSGFGGTGAAGAAGTSEAETSPVLATWHVDGATIEDTAWRRLPLQSPLTGIAGRELALVFVRTETGGNAPSLMQSDGDVYPAGRLSFGGAPLEGDLDVRLELRPGRLGRAAYRLGLARMPVPITAALVVGGVASAFAFLYLSRLRPSAPPH